MRKFLSQFLSAEQVDEIEKAFKNKNPDSSRLPEYVSKTRLDEEIGKRKTAEESLQAAEREKTKAIKEATSPLEEQLKAIPKDWKEQLDAAKKAAEDAKTEYEGKLVAAQKDADISSKIYASGARNVKAVKALLEEDKPVEDQLKALKESDPYLFGRSGMGKGTGRGSDSDTNPPDPDNLSQDAMYRAVGLTPPASK